MVGHGGVSRSRLPEKLLVCDCIAMVHSASATKFLVTVESEQGAPHNGLLDVSRQILGTPSGRIVFLEAIREGLQPVEQAVEVMLGLFLGNDILKDDVAVLYKLVPPVPKGLECVELGLGIVATHIAKDG